MGRRPPPRRRRARQGAPRQGRQPGDGARRRRARRVVAGAVRHQGRGRRQLQGAARPSARRRRRRRAARRRRQPQPVRRGLGARRARPSRPRAQSVGIEMLEGMAPPQSRATLRRRRRLLLYTPVVTDEDFAASIAYLSRRLDENAAPENFLRSLFTITPGSPAWHAERRASRPPSPTATSCPAAPRRTPGPTHRAPPLRPRRAVRQRARHRLHAGRQPGVDQRARSATDRPAALPPLVDDDRRHRRGRRRRARAGAARWSATSTGRAPAPPRPGRRGDGRRPRADARRDGPRDRQDRPRGRPRGVRGDRLRHVGGGVHAGARRPARPTASPPTRSASCSSPARGTSRRDPGQRRRRPRSPPATP